MAQGKFVAYYRVSTVRQGQSGLGLDAQRTAVAEYLNGGKWKLLAEVTEIETGKGSNAMDRRPQLREALALCKKENATLIIAKLDRLSRDVEFLFAIRNGNVEVRACDMPQATTLEFGIRALFAQHEREVISQRTRDALAAAKARGVKLGVAGPTNLRPSLEQRRARAELYAAKMRDVLLGLKGRGLTHRAMRDELNKLEIAAPRGGSWHVPTVQRVLARLEHPSRVQAMAGKNQ